MMAFEFGDGLSHNYSFRVWYESMVWRRELTCIHYLNVERYFRPTTQQLQTPNLGTIIVGESNSSPTETEHAHAMPTLLMEETEWDMKWPH